MTMVGGDQVAESHTANLKKQLRRNNNLSGLPLDSAHIDGLSALFIHENLGLEMVMDAFVRYMAFVKDKINPSKAYVDTTWLTELLNCVSGVCSDLEIQQVVEQFSYMSKMYFLVFLYS